MGGNRELTLPPETVFHSAKILPNEREKKPKPVFLFVCVSIVTPCLDLHLSQQSLRNFSSVHMSGVELKSMGQQILGSYPEHFHLAEDVDERGGHEHPVHLNNLAITPASRGGTRGLLVGHIFY